MATFNEPIKRNRYLLTDEELIQMIQRKADFLSGKTTARSWREIKKDYELLRKKLSN